MEKKLFIVCGILLLSLIVLVAPALAITETYSPDADTGVESSCTYANLDTIHDYLYVMSDSYAADDEKTRNRRSLIHFDLSSVPSDATIESATFYLCIWKISADTTHDMHRMTGDWTESGVTWDTLPGYEPIPTDSASTGTTAGVWLEWDVTTDVQAFVDGTPNFGWLIRDTVESQTPYVYAKYYSREYADPALRPYLEVTYTEGAAAPTADFTADVTSGNAPLTVQFTDASTGDGITGWAWDFENDGTVDSTDQNPSFTYGAGTYTVNLTVTNAGGSDSEVKADFIAVNGLPVADAGPDRDVLVGETVNFNASGSSDPDGMIMDYLWDFGDGTTTTGLAATYKFLTSGIFTVTLTVTDDKGALADDAAEVTVKTLNEGIQEIIDTNAALDLQQGTENSLNAKLEAAQKSLEKGNTVPAKNQLNACLNEIAAQTGKSISEEEAAAMTASIQKIIQLL